MRKLRFREFKKFSGKFLREVEIPIPSTAMQMSAEDR
jgi:hypothetical protein